MKLSTIKQKLFTKENIDLVKRWFLFQGIGFSYLMVYYNKTIAFILVFCMYFLYEYYFNNKDLNIKLYR